MLKGRRCRWKPVFVLILALKACSIAYCAEPSDQSPLYPLWDGHESVVAYARKVNLPPTKTLDLGNGVKMELVLIPAGKFVMGTPEPTPVDEAVFLRQVFVGQLELAVSAVALLLMLAVVIVRAIRSRRRPQLSLALLLLATVAAGVCVLSGLNWRGSVRELEAARLEFAAAKARFAAAEPSEKPAHAVTLTRPFYMGKFDVTQEQYQAVVGTNPSYFHDRDNPVEHLSWNDAQEFCKRLSNSAKESVCLPTEAQWEYACRAGTTTVYQSGDAETDLARIAWYEANSKGRAHAVGQKEPNAFGLYDMEGNVYQWCKDWYGAAIYTNSSTEDPEGPPQGKGRVLRGGSWRFGPGACRASFRFDGFPDNFDIIVGFRVAMPAPSTR